MALSPFNWTDKVMEELGEKVGRMLSMETSHSQTFKDRADQADEKVTIDGLTKKYPWWTPMA